MFLMLAALFAAVMMSCTQQAQKETQEEAVEPEQTDTYTTATPQATDTMSPEDFVAFLEKCGKYFVATVDVDQPRVRPFSFVDLIDGNVYFMTRKPKDVYKQLVKNPKVQIAAFPNEGGMSWMRITCKLVEEETPAIRTHFLDKYPQMKEAHPLDDPDYAFMKLVGITAQMGNKVYQVK